MTGRPTKYKEEYCETILEYFNRERTKMVKKQVVSNKGFVVEIEEEAPNPPPTLYGFAADIGVCRDTLDDWGKAHPLFLRAIKKAKAMQTDFVVSNAMTGNAPAAFSIFMMKNVAMWRDQPKETHEAKLEINLNYDVNEDGK